MRSIARRAAVPIVFSCLTAGADHDRLLAFALDPDHGADPRDAAGVLEALDLDGGRIRQFRREIAASAVRE